MHSTDFFSVFELYKERYLQQDRARENKGALELFEKWLKGNAGLQYVKISKEKGKKIDFSKFFTSIVLETKKILAQKEININGISLGLKESSKCIIVFNDNSIYYRIGKTIPRKGKYSGMELLVMELIMDGNKNNVFVPLLARLSDLQKKIGSTIERENPKVEATGKYRFKMFFPVENDDSEERVYYYSKKLADFIYYTREDLLNLNVK